MNNNFSVPYIFAVNYLDYSKLHMDKWRDEALYKLQGACEALGLEYLKVIKYAKALQKHDISIDLTFCQEDRDRFYSFCRKGSYYDGRYSTLREFNTSWSSIPDHLNSTKKALPHLRSKNQSAVLRYKMMQHV